MEASAPTASAPTTSAPTASAPTIYGSHNVDSSVYIRILPMQIYAVSHLRCNVMPDQTAIRSSPNRKKLQSKPQTTAVQTANDCSPICRRLAEGLELTHVKPLYFKMLLFARNHLETTSSQESIISSNLQAYLCNSKLQYTAISWLKVLLRKKRYFFCISEKSHTFALVSKRILYAHVIISRWGQDARLYEPSHPGESEHVILT